MRRVSPLFDVVRDATGRELLQVYVDGIELLRLTMTNKGTAFTQEERRALRIDGLLPPAVSTLESQVAVALASLRRREKDLDKYVFLRALQERHEVLFYALLERNLKELLPIVYTPTVGEAVQTFSQNYQYPRGLSFSPLNIDRAVEVCQNYPWDDVRMIVATDSSAILGIGDQGYGGLAISIGKLALYTAGGGVSPMHTAPVSLDVGTERTDLLDDPAYLGVRQRRLKGEDYLAFFDRFVAGVKARWPKAIIQWEDLAKESAFSVLERYRKVHPSFNDDIQGTGAVTLAGVIEAVRRKGGKLADERILIYGAGAGGIGVTWALWMGLQREGLSPEEASARIFVLDSKGLLTDDRPCEDYKKPFAQKRARLENWKFAGANPNLLETIENGRITTIVGLSGQAGSFDEAIVKAVAKNTERPIVFALSNPTSICEANPADVIRWTDGKAMVATGSPFPNAEHGGKSIPIGQGNNAFIFPGLGFGSILADASEITDGMVLESAYALADYVAEHHGDSAALYPPVDELRAVSLEVAARVILQAQKDGVNQRPALTLDGARQLAKQKAWKAEYLPIVKAERRTY
jgi:malate dehydrogenase (oxaloacetate-decarboxylating)